MERKAVFGTALAVLLVIVVAMPSSVVPVKAEKLLQLTTDKSLYALGEEVRITLKNIGDEYVSIGGWPCVEIYTYPDLGHVWPRIFAFLAWGLTPGESETWIWNQYNEFTQMPAWPGMYVVKDTQGWGLSAYFQIVTTEERWVPYVPEPWQWWPKEWSLVHWIKDETSYINVSLVWPDTGHMVSNWGTVVKDGYNLWVNTEMWEWTGASLTVIVYESHTYNLGRLEPVSYNFTFSVWDVSVKSMSFIVRPPIIMATLDIDPDTLTLRSEGQWITAYIQLPEGYSAADVNANTILLNGMISPVLDPSYSFVTNSSEYLVDHNNDGILERMVKFNRTAASEFILSKGIWYGDVTLTITGQLNDGTPFGGKDIILVRMPGDVNIDGKVDASDLFDLGKAYCSAMDKSSWNPNCDFNEDNKTDASDLFDLSRNYGKTGP